MNVVLAMYAGTCVGCDSRYPAGTRIVKRDGAWVHEACPPGFLEAQREVCNKCFQEKAANGVCGCDA